MRKKFVKSGFTLTELMVVVGIILIMAAFIFPNFMAGEESYTLQRAAYKVAQDLRRVEGMALSAREYPGADPSFRGGYGINFKIDEFVYILFADLNDSKTLNPGEEMETLSLEKPIKISGLSAFPLDVVFLPPDPGVFISGGPTGQIALSPEDNPAKTKIIKVNQTGLIYVE